MNYVIRQTRTLSMTSAHFPKKIRELQSVTQSYVSIDATTKDKAAALAAARGLGRNAKIESVRLPMLTVLKLHSCEGITSASMAAISHGYMLKVTTSSVEIGSGETAREADVSVSCCTEIDKTTENSVAPTPTTLGSINVETILSNQTKYSDLLARSCHEAHYQDLEGKHSNSESIIFYN